MNTNHLRRSCRRLAGVLLAALGSHAATAAPTAADTADAALSTDRPDFVESSDVVGPGHVQLETGATWTRDAHPGVPRTIELGTPTLLRWGLSPSLELRAETDGLARTRIAGQATTRGMSDLSLGFKWHQQDGNEDGRPGVAWLVDAALPSGSAEYRGQGVRPAVRAVAEWDLPHDFSIGVMPGIALDTRADGHRFASGILAVTLGRDLAPHWHGFLELAGQQLAAASDGGSVVTLDAGLAWAPRTDLQFDAAVFRGLTATSPTLQAGAGLSWRY